MSYFHYNKKTGDGQTEVLYESDSIKSEYRKAAQKPSKGSHLENMDKLHEYSNILPAI